MPDVHAHAASAPNSPAKREVMDEELDRMGREQPVAEVKKLRTGIRADRDSSGNELCWRLA